MNKKLAGYLFCMVLLCLLFAAQEVTALTITTDLSGGISPGYLYSGSHTGQFNMADEMPGDWNNSLYTILSAEVLFSFADDYDRTRISYSNSGWSSARWIIYPTRYGHVRSIKSTYLDESESAVVNIGGQTSNTGIGNYYSQTDAWDYEWDNGRTWGRKWYVTHNERTVNGYGLDTSVNLALAAANLHDLWQDGILNFDLQITGDLNFTSAILTAQLEYTPMPEPSTMLLFGFGILGLARVSRKKIHL